MVVVDEYFHDLMKKILNSYDVIKNLGDSKEDFFVLDVELTKINGLLRVLVRKSDEFSDQELVKLICGMKNNKINGWIYFKQEQEDGNKIIFHDEILICNPYGYIEYIDYHKI